MVIPASTSIESWTNFGGTEVFLAVNNKKKKSDASNNSTSSWLHAPVNALSVTPLVPPVHSPQKTTSSARSKDRWVKKISTTTRSLNGSSRHFFIESPSAEQSLSRCLVENAASRDVSSSTASTSSESAEHIRGKSPARNNVIKSDSSRGSIRGRSPAPIRTMSPQRKTGSSRALISSNSPRKVQRNDSSKELRSRSVSLGRRPTDPLNRSLPRTPRNLDERKRRSRSASRDRQSSSRSRSLSSEPRSNSSARGRPPLTHESARAARTNARSKSLTRVTNHASPMSHSDRIYHPPPSTFRTRHEMKTNRRRTASEGDAYKMSNDDLSNGDTMLGLQKSQNTGNNAKKPGFMEKLFGNQVDRPQKSPFTDCFGFEIRPRVLLAATVYHNTATNLWITTINTNQRGVAKNPLTANKYLKAFSFKTEPEAREAAIANAPPKMVNFSESPSCFICKGNFAVFRRAVHCRNCGVCVCSACSTTWPAKMIPSTYNLKNESQVKICTSCNALSTSFKKALLDGDLEEAFALYGTGNINLRTPFAAPNKHDEMMYPIHCAVEGGNLNLLRWLIDDHFCPIQIHSTKWNKRGSEEVPVVTSCGRSVLDIALENSRLDILRYLVVERGVRIFESKDLRSALHCLEIALIAMPKPARDAVPRPPKPITRWEQASLEGDSEPSSLGVDDPLFDNKSSNRSRRSVKRTSESTSSSKSKDVCILCYDRKINCVATPCGHQVCCLSCSKHLSTCPVCNSQSSFIKIYRP